MPRNEISGATAIVTGASRGFGRGIAAALTKAGARVTGVARDGGQLAEVRAELGESFTPVTGAYFYHQKPRTAHPAARDLKIQDRLLRYCAALTGVTL